jgi:hypothetical protein
MSPRAVRKVASVAPSTVTKVSKGQVAKSKRARAAEARPRASKVVIRSTPWGQVHPVVRATALAAAGGDTRRIEVVSTTEVLVRNHPRGGPRV